MKDDSQLIAFMLERMETLEKFMRSDDSGNETKRSTAEAIAGACKRVIKEHLAKQC